MASEFLESPLLHTEVLATLFAAVSALALIANLIVGIRQRRREVRHGYYVSWVKDPITDRLQEFCDDMRAMLAEGADEIVAIESVHEVQQHIRHMMDRVRESVSGLRNYVWMGVNAWEERHKDGLQESLIQKFEELEDVLSKEIEKLGNPCNRATREDLNAVLISGVVSIARVVLDNDPIALKRWWHRLHVTGGPRKDK